MTGGRLALWNDCAPGHEAAYEAWYQGEHLPERLAIPGFLRGRRYRALTEGPAYFTYYEVTDPDVLTSEAYLARVNDPTPATRTIMSETFRNMSRTICAVAASHGMMRGAYAVTHQGWSTGLEQIVELCANQPALARAELWQAVPDSLGQNSEQALRGPDQQIESCLFVETLTEASAREAAALLDAQARTQVGVYQLMCELQA